MWLMDLLFVNHLVKSASQQKSLLNDSNNGEKTGEGLTNPCVKKGMHSAHTVLDTPTAKPDEGTFPVTVGDTYCTLLKR
jgi:hypothetical protein